MLRVRFCIACGAVNGAVHRRTRRDRPGVEVTNVARIASSSVLHGSRRYEKVEHWPAHNPKVAGSNPAPATNENAGEARCESAGPSACGAENGADIADSRRERGAA